ncbi:MAG: hypothetical protein KC425_07035 [Anaerolineales bacterium]|nr:hypothetical protein [Anaerolineales bacterium]
MSTPQVDVTQLIQKDLDAWTAVLRRYLDDGRVRVTAVFAEALDRRTGQRYTPTLTRYTLTLAGASDPITCIGKRTNAAEAGFYADLAPLHTVAPGCWFSQPTADGSWVLLDDVPNDVPPDKWAAADAQNLIHQLASCHAPYWDQPQVLAQYDWLPRLFARERPYTWRDLHSQHRSLLTEGPGALISEHAIYHAGPFAPAFLQAANGVAVMRSLNGWPGVLGESHLAAAADLLDDPVPMLSRLRDLPVTLLHGQPVNRHWRVTLFEDQRLLDWQKTAVGPGVWDLVTFIEQFDLLPAPDLPWQITLRTDTPATAETLVDTYMLAMRARLGHAFNARDVRQALSAAHCLYVLTTWFPHFASWFAEMPNAYTWQKVNRMPDTDLVGTRFESLIGYRDHLSGVFQRFLQAYRQL